MIIMMFRNSLEVVADGRRSEHRVTVTVTVAPANLFKSTKELLQSLLVYYHRDYYQGTLFRARYSLPLGAGITLAL